MYKKVLKKIVSYFVLITVTFSAVSVFATPSGNLNHNNVITLTSPSAFLLSNNSGTVVSDNPVANAIPGNIYSSTITVTNDTSSIYKLDPATSIGVSLWAYLQNTAPYNTYDYYQKVMDQWLMFKFNIIDPNGNTISVNSYSTITDYSGSNGYSFPDEANMHVYPPVSTDGDYYAKACLSVGQNIVLNPGDSIEVPWFFGLDYDADNGTQGMENDFNFILHFEELTTPPPTPPPSSSYSPIQSGTYSLYLRGYPDNTIKPDGLVTRAEMAMVLYRLSTDSVTDNTVPEAIFSDVSPNAWYAKAITYLYQHEVINGYGDGTFQPDQPITRAEITKMAYMFDQYKVAVVNYFPDVPQGYWAETYIGSAAQKGWVTGYPNGTFCPENPMTRAEMVTLMNHVLNRSANASGILPGIHVFSDLDSNNWAYYDIVEATNSHTYIRNNPADPEIWASIINDDNVPAQD